MAVLDAIHSGVFAEWLLTDVADSKAFCQGGKRSPVLSQWLKFSTAGGKFPEGRLERGNIEGRSHECSS